jgi:hypothetical protein
MAKQNTNRGKPHFVHYKDQKISKGKRQEQKKTAARIASAKIQAREVAASSRSARPSYYDED